MHALSSSQIPDNHDVVRSPRASRLVVIPPPVVQIVHRNRVPLAIPLLAFFKAADLPLPARRDALAILETQRHLVRLDHAQPALARGSRHLRN